MEDKCVDLNAYKIHFIKTNKFKTVTIAISFRRKVKKEEITIRNLLRDAMVSATRGYPSERSLAIATEKLYDLRLTSMIYRVGNYSILTFRTRFLNEEYSEEGMNEESVKFFLDLVSNPRFDVCLDKCKERIKKSYMSLIDNKVKYSICKLLETTKDKPYSYNSYGDMDDLEKISEDDLNEYYHGVIQNDLIDVFVVGDIDQEMVVNTFRKNFHANTIHKDVDDILISPLKPEKVKSYVEKSSVHQTQLTMLLSLSDVSSDERKYVLPIYNDILGGSSNSLLFEIIREKNNYAYYVNSLIKAYDNILVIYAGTEEEHINNVYEQMKEVLGMLKRGKFTDDMVENAKKRYVSSVVCSMDTPLGIISNYFSRILVGTLPDDERIKKINAVKKSDVIKLAKKIEIHTMYTLEGVDDEDSD